MASSTSTNSPGLHQLAEALDDGRARRKVMDHYATARTDTVVCSPHLLLADGTNTANPGITVRYLGGYGHGFPVVDNDDPTIYATLLQQAAAIDQT